MKFSVQKQKRKYFSYIKNRGGLTIMFYLRKQEIDMEFKMSDKAALAVISVISTGIGVVGAMIFKLLG
ncbi:hypothetical protein [Bacillus cereus]|nr:hypothetical protein [Bacillus cereus]